MTKNAGDNPDTRIDPDKGLGHRAVRAFAQKVHAEDLNFSSEQLGPAQNYYVAWLDLMGAGHIMSTSVHKSANFLIRLHMAVEIARMKSGYELQTLPINDGIFIISSNKGALMTVVRHAMILLASRFIATPRPHDRCLMKGAISLAMVARQHRIEKGTQSSTTNHAQRRALLRAGQLFRLDEDYTSISRRPRRES